MPIRRGWSSVADIVTLALEELEHRGGADALALAGRSVSGEADGTALIAEEQDIPTWRPRSYLTEETPVGKPYRWNGQVYRLWQQHDATGQPGWSPDLAFSLWDICHTTDPARAKDYLPPQGSRGLWQTGECCVFGGRVWRSRQDRNAYSPGELPASWEDLGSVQGSSFS